MEESRYLFVVECMDDKSWVSIVRKGKMQFLYFNKLVEAWRWIRRHGNNPRLHPVEVKVYEHNGTIKNRVIEEF